MKKTMGWVAVGSGMIAFTSLPAGRACDTEIEYGALKFYIEYNSSAEDIGVQLFLDGEPWTWLRAETPEGHKMLHIRTRDSLLIQGLTELFWESSEPSLKEVPFDEFLARFPEGSYEFEGETVEGECLEGEALFTHVIPAGPEILSPPQGDTPPVIDPDDFTIEWEPVTETIDGSTDLEIVSYQVIVEQEEPKRVFSIFLPATATSVKVPSEFFEQDDTLHKFEILAIEVGGNQTIAEGEFMTKP